MLARSSWFAVMLVGLTLLTPLPAAAQAVGAGYHASDGGARVDAVAGASGVAVVLGEGDLVAVDAFGAQAARVPDPVGLPPETWIATSLAGAAFAEAIGLAGDGLRLAFSLVGTALACAFSLGSECAP